MPSVRPWIRSMIVLACLAVTGCGGDDEDDDSDSMNGASQLDPQVPPDDAARVVQWLSAFEDEGWEEQWVCEAEPTEKTAGAAEIHAHAKNRVCNNQRLAEATLADAEQLPVGSAALKFVAAGTYVEVKVQADSADGEGWFWRSPDGGVAARGAAACTGCHAAAGSDEDHPGLGDFVYFQVQ